MRLLFVLSEFPPDYGGGIASVYGVLLPHLVDAGHVVTVLLASRDHLDQDASHWRGVQVQPLQQAFLRQAEEILAGGVSNPFLDHFLPVAWAAWAQAHELGGHDLVECTDWALLFVPWLVQERRQPVVVSLHGSCGQVDWYGLPDRRPGDGQLVRLLETALLPLADALIANSQLNAEFWWRQCGARPVVISPLLPAVDPPTAAQRLERGVVVGRLQNWKGPERLCEALRLVPGQQIDWIGADTPWQAGPFSTSAHLRSRFPDVLDRQLILVGSHPPDLVKEKIRTAAFLCVPSLWDVFNVTVLEALAVGTPVICSKEAGASMWIQDGISGFVVDAASPSQLAQALAAVKDLSPVPMAHLTCVLPSGQLFSTTNENRVRAYLDCYEANLAAFEPRHPSPWLLHLLLNGAEPLARPTQSFRARLRSHIRSAVQSLAGRFRLVAP